MSPPVKYLHPQNLSNMSEAFLALHSIPPDTRNNPIAVQLKQFESLSLGEKNIDKAAVVLRDTFFHDHSDQLIKIHQFVRCLAKAEVNEVMQARALSGDMAAMHWL